ncbi:hypothetical protein MGA3_01050 [Bacillus methanolicus MGA3]|nr:hypothetical protein MGA3_01050 [Bacillus methanolicus MGA3]
MKEALAFSRYSIGERPLLIKGGQALYIYFVKGVAFMVM